MTPRRAWLPAVTCLLVAAAPAVSLDTLRVGTSGNVSWSGESFLGGVTTIPPEYKVARQLTEIGSTPGNLIDLERLGETAPRLLVKTVIDAVALDVAELTDQLSASLPSALEQIPEVEGTEIVAGGNLFSVILRLAPGTDPLSAVEVVDEALEEVRQPGINPVVLPIALMPDHLARGLNVAHLALGLGGRIEAPAIKDVPKAELEEVLLELITPEGSEDAFQRKGARGALGTFVVLDLGAPVGVNRVRFYPRNTVQQAPAYPFQNDFLRQFELMLHDGQNLVRDGTGRLVPQLQDYVVLRRTVDNQDAVVDVPISPARLVRFVRLKSISSFPYEVDELEVFGQGFISEARYLSPIYDLGSVATWGNISWVERFIDRRQETGARDETSDNCQLFEKEFATAEEVPETWGDCETAGENRPGTGYITVWNCVQSICRDEFGGQTVIPGRAKRVSAPAARPAQLDRGEDVSQILVRTRIRTSKQGQEARRDYLQTLIDRELLLLEAEARRLQEDSKLQRRLRRKVEDRILSLYRRREIPAVEVSSDEIQSRIREMGLDRERLAEAVRVPSEEEALRLRAGLAGGQRFEELASGPSGPRGGVVGWLNRLTAPRAGIPPAVFDTLATGEVSPPLPLEGTWRLVRFVDDRTSTDPSMLDRVRQRLIREARQEIEDQKVEVLARELDWAPDAGGLAFLAGLDAGNRRIPKLTPSEARTPLFTFEGGVLTVEDYVDAIREHKVRTPRALTDSSFAAALGQRLLQGRALLLMDADRLGLGEQPEIVQWRDQVQREQLLQALRAQIVGGADSMATGERVQAYYDENRESFRLPEEVCFDEILFPDREEAEEVLGQIDDDVQLLELSRLRGNRIRQRRADGLLCANSLSRQVLPGFWQALQEAPVGAVTGPVSLVDQAWVLIKVVRREPERVQTLDEARPRARASLVAGFQRQLFEDWLASERERRGAEIQVFEDRLEAAIPEALLAAPVSEDEG